MTAAPPAELELTPLGRDPLPVSRLVTTFHLLFVALDPYTPQSAALLETAGRILRVYDQSDARVAWVVTSDEDGARQFLGPWADEILTFADPDRSVVKGFGLEFLPALVHLRQDLSIAASAEGWDPQAWKAVTLKSSQLLSWSRPTIPSGGDPGAFPGTPAAG